MAELFNGFLGFTLPKLREEFLGKIVTIHHEGILQQFSSIGGAM